MKERLGSGAELHSFSDDQALEALDHIIRTCPRIIALDHSFSLTSRGAALINRIKDDPALVNCELRVMVNDNALLRVPAGRTPGTAAAVAVADPGTPLDQRGTRRAVRVKVRDGVEVLVDGNAATLIDISTHGVQVLSARVLKPNQRVRIGLPNGTTMIRCSGSIVWASYEMPKGQAPRYRAGIEIAGAEPAAIDEFARRHRQE